MRDWSVKLLNDMPDIVGDFSKPENAVFAPERVVDFNPTTGRGTILWKRLTRQTRTSFNQSQLPFSDTGGFWEFPEIEYPVDLVLPFAVDFNGAGTVRVRLAAAQEARGPDIGLMIPTEPLTDDSWTRQEIAGKGGEAAVEYQSSRGGFRLSLNPFRFELLDTHGRVLTRSYRLGDSAALLNTDPLPLCFVRRAADRKRYFAATLSLSPGERIYGCGESFTGLNKRGQSLPIWTMDAHGALTADMYKPIPTFLSSRGYGAFVHSSAPLRFDFGSAYDGAQTLFVGDDFIDLFLFLGGPKAVLREYTDLTGRSPTPPLWSFGLWMSRITYSSEDETRNVAARLRDERIPCDVIHIDTGWFETDWRCDYRFSPSRFRDPAAMLRDLKTDGFRVCLWQLPYFTRQNAYFKLILERGLAVLDQDGRLPADDAVLDFSNPETTKFYKEKLAGLLKLGVSAIKADFGEAAPENGRYASGRSGNQEHNLYPLRYNRAAAEAVWENSGEHIIWARSAWAGSQRYPLHWGGDAECSDNAMAATLRAGLSFGLSGFAFWSHDIGGFPIPSPEELYGRWLFFGALSSHSRCHGLPPTEPWEYGKDFTDLFRATVELKYRLLPYIYAQARDCSLTGLPMLRALFLEYPDDPTAWLIEDEYLFGRDLLVAPLLEAGLNERSVYFPPGDWIDYFSGQRYSGAVWRRLAAGELKGLLFVRAGACLPETDGVQHTGQINWDHLRLRVCVDDSGRAEGRFCLPDGESATVRAERAGRTFTVSMDADGEKAGNSDQSAQPAADRFQPFDGERAADAAAAAQPGSGS